MYTGEKAPSIDGCLDADPGYFVSSPGATVQEKCDAGKFSNEFRATSCTECPAETYQASSGQSECDDCGDVNRNFATSNFNTEQRGLTNALDCQCADGYTGTNCDIDACGDTLHVVSLGLLLLEASYPDELRESTAPMEERQKAVVSTRTRVEGIFRAADTSGDNRLSREEALNALSLVDVNIGDIEEGRSVWMRPISGEGDSFDRVDDVTITEMITDVMTNFINHGTFFKVAYDLNDSTGSVIFSMDATYPNSQYNTAKCDYETEGDLSDTASSIQRDPPGGVDLSWQFNEWAPGTTGKRYLYRQCAYVNGALLPETVFTYEMVSAQTSGDASICTVIPFTVFFACNFHHPDGVANDNRKRLYCIQQTFCVGGPCTGPGDIDPSLTTTRCITALAFDGTPANISAEIKFTFRSFFVGLHFF